MMNKHEQIFRTLERVAEVVEPVGRGKHAAAIVYKNEIMSLGINSKKTHPIQRRFNFREDQLYMHAESDVIVKTIRKYGAELLTSASLYVMRMKYGCSHKRTMVRGLSKPCRGCMSMIAAFDIPKVYYSDNYGGYERL
jgi:deoxycytidylate deaminase